MSSSRRILQGIFPTQGANPCLIYPALAGWRVVFYILFCFVFLPLAPPGKVSAVQFDRQDFFWNDQDRPGELIYGCRGLGVGVYCPMSESPSGKREGFQDNATRKKGTLLLTRVRAPASSNTVVRGQRAPSPSCYTNLQGEHKQLVAGLCGLVTCLQSNFIGQNFHGLFSNLGVRGLFQLSHDMFPFSYWVHVDWLAPGGPMGQGILPFRGKSKLRSGLPVMVLALAASKKEL